MRSGKSEKPSKPKLSELFAAAGSLSARSAWRAACEEGLRMGTCMHTFMAFRIQTFTYISVSMLHMYCIQRERETMYIHTHMLYVSWNIRNYPKSPHLSLLRSTAGCNKGLGKGKTAIGLPATTLQSLEGRNILNGRRLVLGRPKTTEMYQPALRCLRPSPLTPSASRCSRLLVLHSLGFG